MPFVPPTIPGAQGYPLGLTGATAATRYVGGTTSGAPVAGTFAVGDFIIDETGKVYVCTVAGTPGTWTQAGGGSSSPGMYVTGQTLLPPGENGFSAVEMVDGQLLGYPVFIYGSAAVTFSSIAISVSTLAALSAVRLGWYGVAASGGPGALTYDLGTVASTSTGVKTISTATTLGPGLVWLAAVAQGGTPSVRQNTAFVTPTGLAGGSAGQLTSAPLSVVVASAAAAGALPDPFGAYTWPPVSSPFPRYLITV